MKINIKIVIFISILFFILFGCDNSNEVQEISVDRLSGEGGSKEVYTLNNPKDIGLLKAIIDDEIWRKQTLYTGTNYIGPDYTFSLDGYNYDVLIHGSGKSIMVYRRSGNGEVERAYIPLYEQAEAFYGLITGGNFMK